MNKWELHNCANGNRTCDNSEKTSDDIFETIKLLEKRFSVKYDDKSAAGLDGVYFAVAINNEKVTIGWDIWSGIFIMSMEESGNEVIESVFKYLSELSE